MAVYFPKQKRKNSSMSRKKLMDLITKLMQEQQAARRKPGVITGRRPPPRVPGFMNRPETPFNASQPFLHGGMPDKMGRMLHGGTVMPGQSTIGGGLPVSSSMSAVPMGGQQMGRGGPDIGQLMKMLEEMKARKEGKQQRGQQKGMRNMAGAGLMQGMGAGQALGGGPMGMLGILGALLSGR